MEPKEAVCKDVTAKERAKLLLGEARCRLLPKGRTREDAFQLLADYLVKEGVLRRPGPPRISPRRLAAPDRMI